MHIMRASELHVGSADIIAVGSAVLSPGVTASPPVGSKYVRRPVFNLALQRAERHLFATLLELRAVLVLRHFSSVTNAQLRHKRSQPTQTCT